MPASQFCLVSTDRSIPCLARPLLFVRMQHAVECEDADADVTVVEDTSTHVLAAITCTSALRERLAARKAPEPVAERVPGEEG